MPAHDFGQLLDRVDLMLRHLQQQVEARGEHNYFRTPVCNKRQESTDTWDRRKSCSSCSWCDRVMTRPSLCTTLICSTPMFSCSWIDLDTHRKDDSSCWTNQSINNIHLLADLLITLRGDEHLNAGLVHIVDVGPVSLDLGVFYATGQAVNGPCRPEENTQPPLSAKKEISCKSPKGLRTASLAVIPFLPKYSPCFHPPSVPINIIISRWNSSVKRQILDFRNAIYCL